MRNFTVTSLVIATLLFVVSISHSGEKLEWHWSKKKASLAYSTKKHLPDYDVELVHPREFYTPINIRRKKDRSIVYSLEKGHLRMVFARAQDTLFIAEYDAISSGCAVVALDLKSGKQLWKSRLQGIGPTSHSQYSNYVNIETDGKRIIVTGNEAHGRYVEHLDIKTGKTLANRKLEADPESLFK